MEPKLLALEVQYLDKWTSREVPVGVAFLKASLTQAKRYVSRAIFWKRPAASLSAWEYPWFFFTNIYWVPTMCLYTYEQQVMFCILMNQQWAKETKIPDLKELAFYILPMHMTFARTQRSVPETTLGSHQCQCPTASQILFSHPGSWRYYMNWDPVGFSLKSLHSSKYVESCKPLHQIFY